MNPFLNTPKKIWLYCINISVQKNPCPCGYYPNCNQCHCTQMPEALPKTTEDILQAAWNAGSYLDISTLNRTLMELELSGYARQNGQGRYSL